MNTNVNILPAISKYKSNIYQTTNLQFTFNRPDIAGAVLQTTSSLSDSWFVEIYSKHCQSQTGRARELKF